MKLAYKLDNFDNLVLFKVLGMDERFRFDEGENPLYEATNMTVTSLYSPELLKDVVYLQGKDKGDDNCVVTLELDSKEEAEEYVKKVHEALKEWGENWEGWGYPVKPIENPDCYIIP